MRAEYMTAKGLNPHDPNLPIVPYLDKPGGIEKGIEFYSGPVVRKMFNQLRKVTGIPISPKDLRTSYGQVLKDRNVPIEQVQVHLRHTSVQTTQAFYATLRPDKAYKELDRYFQEPVNGTSTESNGTPNPRIDESACRRRV